MVNEGISMETPTLVVSIEILCEPGPTRAKLKCRAWGRGKGTRGTSKLLGSKFALNVSCAASSSGPLFIFGFERAWCAKIHHGRSLWTSVGVSMETPPFTMTSLQSDHGQVVAWCEYLSNSLQQAVVS